MSAIVPHPVNVFNVRSKFIIGELVSARDLEVAATMCGQCFLAFLFVSGKAFWAEHAFEVYCRISSSPLKSQIALVWGGLVVFPS